MVFENTYVIFKEELTDRGIWKSLGSLFTGAPPPHQINGILELNSQELYVAGYTQETQKETSLRIRLQEITQIYHGYDKVFHRFMVHGGGFLWAPIRISFVEDPDDDTNCLYLVAGFTGFNCANATLFYALKSYLERF